MVKNETFKVQSKDGFGILTEGITEEMTHSSFWTSLLNECFISPVQIKRSNDEIVKRIPNMKDLSCFKEELSKDAIINLINTFKLPDRPMYDSKGKLLEQEFYHQISENRNLTSLRDTNSIKYGLTVNNASIRSFPTEIGVFSTKEDTNLDRFQETGCEAFEAVLILHESKDESWYFVKTYNYYGWMRKDAVALSSRGEVFGYYNSKDFLIVTGKSLTLNHGSPEVKFSMGTKLPIIKIHSSHYEVKLPKRLKNGFLSFYAANISKDEDVYRGYLPCTKYNLITQAFKLQGISYDWGDKFSGYDCSSYIMNLFKPFGVMLPRNSGEQAKCLEGALRFNPNDSLQDRVNVLSTLSPGTPLYMPGHAMLYLGERMGQHYVIHAFLGYYRREGNEYKYCPVNQIAVSTLSVRNSEGLEFALRLNSALPSLFNKA